MENRRDFLKKTGLMAAAGMLPWQRIFGIMTQEASYHIAPLRGKLMVFTEQGGTIAWMAGEDGIAVVDAQFPPQAEHLIAEIRKHSDKKVDILFNTHHHSDHTAGNIAFKDIVKTIVAHENSKKNQEAAAKARGVEDQQLYPTELYTDSWLGKVGSEPIRLYYFGPAHTDGDSIVHFENSNVVHMGDLVFNRRHPYIDKAAGASIENWMQVLEKARKTFSNDSLFVFGHAGAGYEVTGNKADLAAMEHYLDRLLAFTMKLRKEGKTLEEAISSEGVPGAPGWKGEGMERVIRAAWQELEEKG